MSVRILPGAVSGEERVAEAVLHRLRVRYGRFLRETRDGLRNGGLDVVHRAVRGAAPAGGEKAVGNPRMAEDRGRGRVDGRATGRENFRRYFILVLTLGQIFELDNFIRYGSVVRIAPRIAGPTVRSRRRLLLARRRIAVPEEVEGSCHGYARVREKLLHQVRLGRMVEPEVIRPTDADHVALGEPRRGGHGHAVDGRHLRQRVQGDHVRNVFDRAVLRLDPRSLQGDVRALTGTDGHLPWNKNRFECLRVPWARVGRGRLTWRSRKNA